MHPIRRSLTAAALLVAIPAAHAGLVINGSFEAPLALSAASNQYCYLNSAANIGCNMTTLSVANFGWTGTAPVIRANSSDWGTPNTLAGYAHGNQLVGIQARSSIEQTLDLIAGTYTLTWADAGRRNYAAALYDVEFDSLVLGSFGTAAGQAWGQRSLTFFAAGDGTLKFKGRTAVDGTAFIDNVSVTLSAAAVPEPGSLALVMAALAATGLALRGKRA
jgi:hypothetical protein